MSSSASSSYCFTLGEIKEATNNFDEKKVLGHGGEGNVYLANIHLHRQNEKTPVAVKHLKPNSSDQFEKEIQTISKIHHPNLVSLLGHCQESGQKILVYEYMQNGSLSDYVKKNIGTPNYMPWNRRLNICIGVARGLQHLHTPTVELPKGIIHRDIKPANILLDKNWVAKVSDFGLFKLSQAGQTHSGVVTDLKGTRGYCAPEYCWLKQISRKSDVFAFGVVMFEVLCRKSPWNRGEESYIMKEDDDLGLWAQENVDTEIKEEISEDSLVAFTEIIGRCLQEDPTKRPIMDDIVRDLERCRICTGCKEIGHGRLVLWSDGAWHTECFRCHHCDLLITESEFSLSDENRPFHISCYKELYQRCDICKNFIPTTAAGLIDSLELPFWKQKICRAHKEESRCLGCGRIEAWDTKNPLLEDGRKLCPECLDSAIMDTNKCQPLYLEIQEFYERLNMKIDVPLQLVERQELNEAMKRETYRAVLFDQSTEIQGLILFNIETFSVGDLFRAFKYPHRLTWQGKVKAILILYGLPRLLIGRILVHGMMLAWLRLEEYPSLSPDVEQSICEMLAHKWLTSKIMECSGSSAASTSSRSVTTSSFEKQLGEYYKYKQESNTSPSGDAFRKGQKAVLKYGLQRTLKFIKVFGTFQRCET